VGQCFGVRSLITATHSSARLPFPTPSSGRPALDGPYEGVPDLLRRSLTRWLENTITPDTLAPDLDEAGLDRLAALLRIDLRGTDGYGMLSGILAWAGDDDERLLMSSTTPELTAREA
jgi:hypothetical protein